MLFGAFAVYVISFAKGIRVAENAARAFVPNKPDIFYLKADLAFTITLGFVAGVVFNQPQTFAQAFVAGLTWPSTVRIITSGIVNVAGPRRGGSKG